MSMAAMMRSRPWYRGLDANQWKTMIASNIGWMFDGYETYALILTVGVALHQLLDPSQHGQIPALAGTVIGITLLGWGVGGFVGGVLADYIGRRRTSATRDQGKAAADLNPASIRPLPCGDRNAAGALRLHGIHQRPEFLSRCEIC